MKRISDDKTLTRPGRIKAAFEELHKDLAILSHLAKI